MVPDHIGAKPRHQSKGGSHEEKSRSDSRTAGLPHPPGSQPGGGTGLGGDRTRTNGVAT